MFTTETTSSNDPWMSAMRRGDFERAWIISDRILHQRIASGEAPHHGPRHLQYVWTGGSLADQRVLVRCYHGLGDTIQFIRFAAPLRSIAREVIVWAQPELVELVSGVRGVDRVLPLHDGIPEVDYDIDIEIMELPHALRATRETMPRSVPYISPKPAVQSRFLPRLEKERPAVGVVWEAGDWNRCRCVPLELISRLASACPVPPLSFQRGPARAQAAAIPAIDISSADVNETASLVSRLDLLITIDTMVAHLAGALGTPVFLMLHTDCDWRWMQGRGRSVWYPTMRMFRQSAPGEWMPVIEEIAAALPWQYPSLHRQKRIDGVLPTFGTKPAM